MCSIRSITQARISCLILSRWVLSLPATPVPGVLRPRTSSNHLSVSLGVDPRIGVFFCSEFGEAERYHLISALEGLYLFTRGCFPGQKFVCIFSRHRGAKIASARPK